MKFAYACGWIVTANDEGNANLNSLTVAHVEPASEKLARALIAQANSFPAFPLSEICAALGWQGGTIHDAISEICKLRARVKALESFKRSVDEALNSGNGSYRP